MCFSVGRLSPPQHSGRSYCFWDMEYKAWRAGPCHLSRGCNMPFVCQCVAMHTAATSFGSFLPCITGSAQNAHEQPWWQSLTAACAGRLMGDDVTSILLSWQ